MYIYKYIYDIYLNRFLLTFFTEMRYRVYSDKTTKASKHNEDVSYFRA